MPALRSGFSLVELMLALATAVLLVTLLFSLSRTVWRSVDGQDARLRSAASLAQALQALAADLGNAAPAPGYDEGGFLLTTAPEHLAPRAQLTFCTARRAAPAGESDDLRWLEMWAVDYRIETDTAGQPNLVRRQRPLAGPGADQPPTVQVLASGIEEFTVTVRNGDEWYADYEVPAVTTTEEEMRWPIAARVRLTGTGIATRPHTYTTEFLLPAGQIFRARDPQN
jgi:type II secretory pathway component PulJ